MTALIMHEVFKGVMSTGLVIVTDIPRLTVRHPKTMIHTDESHDVIIHLHPLTVRHRSSDCRQLHFQPGSAILHSSPSLTIVWSNYQNCDYWLLWSPPSQKVTLSPNVLENWDHNIQLSCQLRWTPLTGRCNHVIDQDRYWLVNRRSRPPE